MRLKRSPLLFLQLSGLYISDIKGKNAWRRLPSLIAPAVLFTITFIYHCRAFYRGAQIFMTNPIQNVEYAVIFGWEFQSVVAAIFLFYWWRTGTIQFFEQALKYSTADNKSRHVVSTEMKATITKYLKILIALTLVGTARTTASSVYRWVEQGRTIMQPMLGIHRFDFIYRLIGVYQLYLLNCIVLYFMATVRSLTLQLEEFNREFQELMHSRNKEDDMSEKLLGAFSTHKMLAQKIREADKLLRSFIFFMLVTGVPMSVCGAITLIRRDKLVPFIFAFYDVIFCVVQLSAFTVIPAQLYEQLHAIPSHIYWSSTIWNRFNPDLFQIARTFTENVLQLPVGLSFGGLVLIRKSSILMAIVLIVPYVILSYQLYTESMKTTKHSTFG
ncbi:CRE-GUR-5 protein [Ditylenchus destructor]|nr:CRE-GUR-5 protein [Ditylenchus destructor]